MAEELVDPAEGTEEPSNLLRLPVLILGDIFISAGKEAAGAALCSKATHRTFLRAVSSFVGASRFLIKSSNKATAVTLVYEDRYSELLQLLQAAAPVLTAEGVVLRLLRELEAAGSSVGPLSASSKHDLLCHAALKRQVSVLRYLDTAGANTAANGATALGIAAHQNFPEAVAALVAAGVDGEARAIAAVFAWQEDHMDLVATLTAGAEARRQAFHVAGLSGQTDMVEAFVAGVGAEDRRDALRLAVLDDKPEAVAVLAPRVGAEARREALLLAVSQGRRAGVVEVLGPHVDEETRNAALRFTDSGEVVAGLVAAGVGAEASKAAFMTAVNRGRADVVEVLAPQVNEEARSKGLKLTRSSEMAAALLAAGVGAEGRSKALVSAAAGGREGVVAALLEAGVKNGARVLALSSASANGHEGVAAMLRAAGA